MKITIESTSRIVQIEGPHGTIPARVWEGTTDSGIPVICAITRVATPSDGNTEQFDRELQACKPPSQMAVEAIPLRMII